MAELSEIEVVTEQDVLDASAKSETSEDVTDQSLQSSEVEQSESKEK